MEKVLITGATGLIGSHVAEALCESGYSCLLNLMCGGFFFRTDA